MKWLAVLILFFGFNSLAANIADVVYEGVSDEKSRAASRKDVMEKAIEETSLDLIRQMIGEEKTSRNMQIIKNYVIKDSGKYILKIKGESIERVDNQFKMSFRLEVALDNLKQILLANGLLYEMETSSKVLPFISWNDKVSSEAFSWWTTPLASANPMGVEVIKKMHSSLQKELATKGFYGSLPMESNFQMLIPPGFSNERLNNSDMLFLGEYFSAPIVLKGEVTALNQGSFGSNYLLKVKIVAYQSLNGRVIGEVSRQFPTDNGNFNLVVNKKWSEVVDGVAGDLSSQIFNSWQKGTFGSSLIRITLQGDLPYQQMANIKEKLQRVGDIRAIRERLFEPGAVTFEVDTSQESKKLAQIIQSINLAPVVLKIDEVSASQVLFDVKTQK
ncbi:MAG: hypothetical protein R2827_10090 [Bdellovibrionales bacterium]